MSLTEIIIALLAIAVPVILWWLDRRARDQPEAVAPVQKDVVGIAAGPGERQPPPGTYGEPRVGVPLRFENVPKYNASKGYLPHWRQGKGSYDDPGNYFLWLEYECNLDKPHRVKIQVEGQTAAISPEGNRRKVRLWEAVEAACPEVARLAAEEGWSVERGRKSSLAGAMNSLSTTVYTVVPQAAAAGSSADPKKIAHDCIEAVHAKIGAVLDRAWDEGTEDL